MPDDGLLRRSRFGSSSGRSASGGSPSTALSTVVIDVTPQKRNRPGWLSLAWIGLSAALVGFVAATLALGIRPGGELHVARLWLPAAMPEPPPPLTVAAAAPQAHDQVLPVPAPENPPVVIVAPPVGSIGPLGEPLPPLGADPLPMLSAIFPLPLPPVAAVAPAPDPVPETAPESAPGRDGGLWVGRIAETATDARAAPPRAQPPTRTAAADRAGPRTPIAQAPVVRASPLPTINAGSPGSIAPASVGGLPALPAPRQVARQTVVPPPPDTPANRAIVAAVPVAAPQAAAWTRNARPFEPGEQRPRIAIIVTELGLSQPMTDQAIHYLSGAVTLAFSPYADGLERSIKAARDAGHEVLLNLPMEPSNFAAADPGPQALLTSLTAQQNLSRLDWILSRADGYVGVASLNGGRFVASERALQPVLASLRDRGFVYVEKTVGAPSVAPRLARELGVPRAIADGWIDSDPTRASIDARLAEIERVARDAGSAVAIAQPLPVTFERLAIWQTTLAGKSLVLAPISAIVNRQQDR